MFPGLPPQMQQSNLSKTILLAGCSLLIASTVGTCIHESGHVLTGLVLGGHLDKVWIFPGIQLYPNLRFLPMDSFPGVLGGCGISGLDGARSELVNLMGSGSTMIVAYLMLLPILPSATWATYVGMISSYIFALDIVLYSTLPLIGARHWIIIGGNEAEPLLAAAALGIPIWLYFTFLTLHVVVFHVLWLSRWRNRENRGDGENNQACRLSRRDSAHSQQ